MTKLSVYISLLSIALFAGSASAVSVDDYPYLQTLVKELVVEHGLDEAELRGTFDKVQLRPKVVSAIKRPAERLPWHRYKDFFINQTQMDKGVIFWQTHQKALARAERETGVPAHVIVAIIGIETRYGATLGSHPVLDSLTTLTLEYPRRQKFFGEQLKHFLLLTHEHSIDRFATKGSYAGAIGIPQFMPTSYRQYAIDFNGDGRTDLVNQVDDAIGSVANYLNRFKWQAGEPVVIVPPKAHDLSKLATTKRKTNMTIADLKQRGVDLAIDLAADTKVGVVDLEETEGKIQRITFDNFYVIMRYNPSILYAMAVHELSSALKSRYDGS